MIREIPFSKRLAAVHPALLLKRSATEILLQMTALAIQYLEEILILNINE